MKTPYKNRQQNNILYIYLIKQICLTYEKLVCASLSKMVVGLLLLVG